MKTMWLAFLAIGVISVAAYFVLQNAGFSAEETHAGENVRLDP
ncbi:hypothetical protein PSA7680_01452 [Pseudoruegeria aquimaris]|uniref:Uncharacterized protein n=1 Tax=Pseudoruegeria aquimaris TaxID=393663 RepID=A0A1Y5S1M4_9RHOB|nr:hypothetical protein [Pseudoruegeria aquimaris]SLN30414.1 hypothetical protein PSA7680_01452 [Pseudoruegeria aquimaris]